MSQPFIGEIRMFGGNFAPFGWAFCNGAVLPIDQNDALFTLIGTTYGGDGEVTFNLPNLSGRLPIHQGTGSSGTTYTIGEFAGSEAVTLSVNQIPAHTHPAQARDTAGNSGTPTNSVWAKTAAASMYTQIAPDTSMGVAAVQSAGGSQPHENMMPFLVVSFIIATSGIFPPRT
jgi:microcystin-dependent protein